MSFTQAQLDDDDNVVDWAPQEHPPAPAVVAHARPGGPTPCGNCHLMNGQGFIAAANLTGLSKAYIVQQVEEFRSGRRRSAQKDRRAIQEMTQVAKKVTDAELADAAMYFSSLPRRVWFRVVETDTVPATRPTHFGWLDLAPDGGTEPIAGRIIEVPEDTSRTFMSDPHSGIVDYVPIGALARGEALVRSGGPGGQPCASCHGADLRGVGDTPPLAGRSPAYLARALWDIKTGARSGPAVAPMQTPAGGLDKDQITDIVAYLGSLKP